MKVVLLRHAQASVNGPDYDQLSSHGYEQAASLGQHLRERPWHPSVVCYGPRRRHRQTWETLVRQGNTWPDATRHDALDELPAEEILALAMPILARSGAPVLSEAQSFASGVVTAEMISKLMGAAITLWMGDELPEAQIETWEAFKSRVHQTLEGLAAHARPQEPAVAVTSGGFIATALGLLLGHSPAEVRETMWEIPNGSITILERESSGLNWHVTERYSAKYLPSEQRTWI